MLQSIQQTWLSLSSYSDMRPDFKLRSHINRTLLQSRPTFHPEAWFEQFWRRQGIALPVVRFVQGHLTDYSGLWWERIVPGDRLLEDLHLPLVCWFDWELQLQADLQQDLGLAMEEPILLFEGTTVQDFVGRLNEQYLAIA